MNTICRHPPTAVEMEQSTAKQTVQLTQNKTWWGGPPLFNKCLQNLTKPTTDILNVTEKSQLLSGLSPGRIGAS